MGIGWRQDNEHPTAREIDDWHDDDWPVWHRGSGSMATHPLAHLRRWRVGPGQALCIGSAMAITRDKRVPIPAPTAPATLRSNVPLPAYRYVPGLNPHPFRHEGGHMYVDGSPPPTPPWTPTKNWHTDPTALYAADLFDNRYYWEAHEAWDCMWHGALANSTDHKVLQSLIQVAASILQHHMGSANGHRSLLNRSVSRLRDASIHCHHGIDMDHLFEQTHEFFDGGPWPTLPWSHP